MVVTSEVRAAAAIVIIDFFMIASPYTHKNAT